MQLIPHTPALHVAVPLIVTHLPPQNPQCSVEVSKSVSHAFAQLLSQFPVPVLHEHGEYPQTPAVQMAVPPVVGQFRARARWYREIGAGGNWDSVLTRLDGRG